MRLPKSLKFNHIKFHKVLTKLCRYLYVVGIQSVRILKRINRRAAKFFRPFTNLCKRIYIKTIGKQVHNIQNEIVLIKAGFHAQKKSFQNAKENGVSPTVGHYIKAAGMGVANHRHFFAFILNIAAPVVACVILVFTVQYWTNLNYGLVLSCDGKPIATIENENVFEKATEMVNQRMVYDAASTAKISVNPMFELTIADSSQYTAASTVCDKLIEQSNGIIEEASGLYVNGNLIGAVKSSADLSYILQNILNNARGTDSSAKASFAENVETINGLFPTGSIISADAMNKKLMGETASQVSYAVKAGDTLEMIASNYDIGIDVLKRINNLSSDTVHIGDKLKIKTAKTLLNVQLIKQQKYQVPLAYKTITVKDDSNYTDYTKVTVDGKDGVQECVDQVTYENGAEIARTNISKRTVTDPVNKTIVTGTKKRPLLSGVGTGSFIWPVPSIHNITSYYEMRWGTMHWGIDIAGSSSYGRTIVAADSGTVSYVQYSDYGYGNNVEIDHGNGISTHYAHASRILVSPGQKVAKGQAIALIGCSGDATGPHLHFEVIRNGYRVNPMNYVSP